MTTAILTAMAGPTFNVTAFHLFITTMFYFFLSTLFQVYQATHMVIHQPPTVHQLPQWHCKNCCKCKCKPKLTTGHNKLPQPSKNTKHRYSPLNFSTLSLRTFCLHFDSNPPPQPTNSLVNLIFFEMGEEEYLFIKSM